MTEHCCGGASPTSPPLFACTEEQVAETLERMALALPEDAIRLQAHAARARRFATLERDRATTLGLPS